VTTIPSMISYYLVDFLFRFRFLKYSGMIAIGFNVETVTYKNIKFQGAHFWFAGFFEFWILTVNFPSLFPGFNFSLGPWRWALFFFVCDPRSSLLTLWLLLFSTGQSSIRWGALKQSEYFFFFLSFFSWTLFFSSWSGWCSPYWRCYFSNTDAIIYVVDSCDRERLSVSKDELVSMMQVGTKKKKPLSSKNMTLLKHQPSCSVGGRAEGGCASGLCQQAGELISFSSFTCDPDPLFLRTCQMPWPRRKCQADLDSRHWKIDSGRSSKRPLWRARAWTRGWIGLWTRFKRHNNGSFSCQHKRKKRTSRRFLLPFFLPSFTRKKPCWSWLRWRKENRGQWFEGSLWVIAKNILFHWANCTITENHLQLHGMGNW